MRDTIEFETRGLPVALITAAGRIPTITKRKGVFFLYQSRGKLFNPERLETPEGQRGIAKFSYHRQLRMAGCKDGDEVDVSGTRLKWKYPSVEFEENKWNWPSGFAKWHSRADGIKKLKAIETPDPTVGL